MNKDIKQLKKETINVLLGRLRIAIQFDKQARQSEILGVLSDKIMDLGVKYPNEVGVTL